MSELNPFEDTQNLALYAEEILRERVCTPIYNSGYGHLVFSCPLCGEGKSGRRKKRGNWYGDTASYFCFNSGCIANDHALSALGLVAALEQVDQATANVDYIKWYNKNVKNGELKDIEEVENPTQEVSSSRRDSESSAAPSMFEDTWVELPEIVLGYCNERHLFEAPFAPPFWKLYFDVATKRLVIPWFNSVGECVYWQKRALIKGDDPKYLYSSGSKRPIFNLDRISDDFPWVFIHEGALDAIFVKNSVAVGAISPSHSQSQELFEAFPMHEKVYFTDNPWVDASCMKMLVGDHRAGQRGILDSPSSSRFFAWPSDCKFKDVNECVCNDRSYLQKITDPDWLQRHIVNSLQMKLILSRSVNFKVEG